MIIKTLLIMIIVLMVLVNHELRKQLENTREINRDLRRSERTFKAMLDRINFKSKTAYKEDIWCSHKALKEIEKMSEYKKALDNSNQPKI